MKLKSFFPHLDLYESLKKTREKAVKKTVKVHDCESCGLYKSCNSPKMPGYGNPNATIMFIGERPGAEEDALGKPFIGRSGQSLRLILRRIGINPEECYISNATRCFVEGNPPPTQDEIKACFPFLEQEILTVKPEIIVLLGGKALESIIGQDEITKYSGYLIPYHKYNTTLLPTFHPSNIVRDREQFDIAIYKDLQKLTYARHPIKQYREDNTVLSSYEEIKTLFETFANRRVAFDIENMGGTKPYESNARILTCAVAFNPDESYTFDMKDEYIDILKRFLSGNATKIIHNFKYEYTWLKKMYGFDIPIESIHDTMLFSYLLKETRGIHSLDFQAFVRLGDHKIENPYLTHMEDCPHDLLHEYTGKDVRLGYRIWEDMYPQITETLHKVYKELLLEGSWATIQPEMDGAEVDKEIIKELQSEYDSKIEETVTNIYNLPEIAPFKGKLNINSTTDVKKILLNVYHLDVQSGGYKTTKKGNTSVDHEVLEHFATDNGFCKLLLEYRDVMKASSTYLKGIKNHISGDGLIHTNYNLHIAESGRLSSNSPNLQNVTKRKHPQIRRIFPAPKGYVILGLDLVSTEVRGACIVSHDAYLEHVILNGIDPHEYWARRIYADIWNISSDEERKKLRYYAKNRFVFPLLYGASAKTIAEGLGISRERGEELWNEFFRELSGLHNWQKEQKLFYQKHGYIETLFGRRRRAPLSHTQLINTPIQSLMSDFTLLALIRVVKAGFRVVFTIHDDITVYVPEQDVLTAYKEIDKLMTTWDFPWLNVPLVTEGKVGYNWYEMVNIEDLI